MLGNLPPRQVAPRGAAQVSEVDDTARNQRLSRRPRSLRRPVEAARIPRDRHPCKRQRRGERNASGAGATTERHPSNASTTRERRSSGVQAACRRGTAPERRPFAQSWRFKPRLRHIPMPPAKPLARVSANLFFFLYRSRPNPRQPAPNSVQTDFERAGGTSPATSQPASYPDPPPRAPTYVQADLMPTLAQVMG